MSYFNNFFTTDDKKKSFFDSKGYADNTGAQEYFNKAFTAADQSGQRFLSDYDFNNGTGIDWDDFSSGMSQARQQGWDNWWGEYADQNDSEDFDDNPFGSKSSFINAFNDTGDLFSFTGESDPWDALLVNNPNFGAYADVTNNITTTRQATQEDVDAGRASAVGEEIMEYNIPSLFDTQRAGYFESFKDLVEENKLKEVAAQDYLQQLLGLTDTQKTELGKSIDLFKTAEDKNILDSEGRKNTAINDMLDGALDNVSLYNTDMTSVLDTFFNTGKTTDDAYAKALDSSINTYDTASKSAIEALAKAEGDNALSKYKAITDALRGDNMLAKRAGEFGTSGSTNKLLVDAAMRAASDKQGVLEDIELDRQRKLFELANEKAQLSKSVDDMTADLDKSRADAKAYEVRNLGNFTADQKFEIENNRDQLLKGVKDWKDSSQFDLYSNLSTERKALRDRMTEMEFRFGQEFQASLKRMRDEFATAIGSTPDETDPIMQLVNEFIGIEAARGKVNIENEIEFYKANKDVLQQIVDNPNTFIQLIGMQVADEVAAMGYKDEMIRDLRQDKFDNIGDITGIIEGLADYENNEDLRAMVEELTQLGSIMQGMGGTLGTNPTQRPQITVPEADLSALAELLSANQNTTGSDLSGKIVDWILDNAEGWFSDDEVTGDDPD